MKLGRSNPWRNRSANQTLSATSVLRPGRARMCCGLTSITACPPSSKMVKTGYQNTPVDSRDTCWTCYPGAQDLQGARHRAERADLTLHCPIVLRRQHARHRRRLLDIAPTTPLIDHLHSRPPALHLRAGGSREGGCRRTITFPLRAHRTGSGAILLLLDTPWVSLTYGLDAPA